MVLFGLGKFYALFFKKGGVVDFAGDNKEESGWCCGVFNLMGKSKS
jgi:hypothetical protein